LAERLKAFLARCGVDEEALRKRPVGHDVIRLWKEAHNRGLALSNAGRNARACTQALDRILSRAIVFLESAQERTHRDIANRLNRDLRLWLPRITGGRYADARVNPARLAVEIRGAAGHWRDARQLSHGTAEQVYLLLRIAMAKHLAVTGESSPLILDDVTVHCDRERTTAT